MKHYGMKFTLAFILTITALAPTLVYTLYGELQAQLPLTKDQASHFRAILFGGVVFFP